MGLKRRQRVLRAIITAKIEYVNNFLHMKQIYLESIENVEGVWWDNEDSLLTHPMIHKYLSITYCIVSIVLRDGDKNVCLEVFESNS